MWRRRRSTSLAGKSALEALVTIISLAPIAFLVLSVGALLASPAVLSEHFALSAAGGILIMTALGWSWTVFRPTRFSEHFSLLDIIISSLLGPVYVLRELPRDRAQKRKNDIFIVAASVPYTCFLVALTATAPSVVMAALALVCVLDALVQLNRQVELSAVLSRRAQVLGKFIYGQS